MGIARGSQGVVTGDGTALSVTLGFRPKSVKLVNITGVIVWEKIDGMLDSNSLKTVTAGTLTVDTTSALVITDTGFLASAAANVSAASLVWYAE